MHEIINFKNNKNDLKEGKRDIDGNTPEYYKNFSKTLNCECLDSVKKEEEVKSTLK
ncbi:MAG: hypothetical protein ACRC1T_07710 [Clostridium chrysemydis]|uniref:hypothetical protein n=1 Tax=Clostridium chrysemydis TaxID=2665504 RepID=UPI003F3E7E6F